MLKINLLLGTYIDEIYMCESQPWSSKGSCNDYKRPRHWKSVVP